MQQRDNKRGKISGFEMRMQCSDVIFSISTVFFIKRIFYLCTIVYIFLDEIEGLKIFTDICILLRLRRSGKSLTWRTTR